MHLSDIEIIQACSVWPTSWHPSMPDGSISEVAVPVQNPGPLVSPLNRDCLGPMSLDIGLGTVFRSTTPLSASTPGGMRTFPPHVENEVPRFSTIILLPTQVLLGYSEEEFNLPPAISGRVTMRSTFARHWLDHSNADLIQPGQRGRIVYELRNNGTDPFGLRIGEDRVLQISFTRLSRPPMRIYGGIYNDQKSLQ